MYPILQPFQNQLQNLQNQFLAQPVSNEPTVHNVNGRPSVDNFPMQPNTTAWFVDNTKSTFYIKRADASGVCTVETYDYYKAEEPPKEEFVTRSEFELLKKNFGKIVDELGIKSEGEE